MSWIITNDNQLLKGKEFIDKGRFQFESSEKPHSSSNKRQIWYFEGYILPRKGTNITNVNGDTHKLLEIIYEKYGEEFIKYIKGSFIIILIEENSFKIYSDRFAIKKFFVWENNDTFIISNNFKVISSYKKLIPSRKNIVIYSLTFHFTGGSTLFKNTFHNEPGQILAFNGQSLRNESYWNPQELLNLNNQNLQVHDISVALQDAVGSMVSMTDKKRISLSLTGGADTRNLLAVFLKKQLDPHLYTYGNPLSSDCQKSRVITDKLNLRHDIHDIKMNGDVFEQYARRIINMSGGMTSIHRVHRLMAIEQEKEFADWMFLGTLGGEYVKGVSEDGYIDPPIVYENWTKTSFQRDDIKTYFLDKNLTFDNGSYDDFIKFFVSEPYMNGNHIERKHQSLSYITAHLHDAQDINMYESVMKRVFTPFLDIDYLELLFSSQFSFDKKEKISNKYLKKINNPVYSAQFLKTTYPALTNYMYSGEHHPKDVLFNKYYAAVLKAIRKRFKPTYPPNFPLSDWMIQFVQKNLPLCKDYNILNDSFDLDGLLNSLDKDTHIPAEAYWLKYTNPIMMRFILEEFAYE